MSGYQYIRSEDIREYQQFCAHHIRAFARNHSEELWHYTDANGLIGILKTRQMWATQVSCLNDTLEQRHFAELIHAAVKARRKQHVDPLVEPLFRIADEELNNLDLTAAGQFVACFSEAEDDLNQWRGYGGGECGYAIGFRLQNILDVIKGRPNTFLLPMGYADNIHNFIVADVIRCAEIYFKQGLSRHLPADPWAREFLAAFGNELSIISALVKHPKFSGESEYRISTHLQTGEHDQLIFRQKRTLLARHLPLDLAVQTDCERHLPITRIYVGPGPAQKVSKISVGDLLIQCKYQNIPVELSRVPYRIP
jgi:hypothetical protein